MKSVRPSVHLSPGRPSPAGMSRRQKRPLRAGMKGHRDGLVSHLAFPLVIRNRPLPLRGAGPAEPLLRGRSRREPPGPRRRQPPRRPRSPPPPPRGPGPAAEPRERSRPDEPDPPGGRLPPPPPGPPLPQAGPRRLGPRPPHTRHHMAAAWPAPRRPRAAASRGAGPATPRQRGPARPHLHVVLLILAGPAVSGHSRHQPLRHRLHHLEAVGVCGGEESG